MSIKNYKNIYIYIYIFLPGIKPETLRVWGAANKPLPYGNAMHDELLASGRMAWWRHGHCRRDRIWASSSPKNKDSSINNPNMITLDFMDKWQSAHDGWHVNTRVWNKIQAVFLLRKTYDGSLLISNQTRGFNRKPSSGDKTKNEKQDLLKYDK
jgi:hypothetical protein